MSFHAHISTHLFLKISFNEMMDGSYERFKGKKLWGSYGILGSPQMVVNDLELIKDVLIKVGESLVIINKY